MAVFSTVPNFSNASRRCCSLASKTTLRMKMPYGVSSRRLAVSDNGPWHQHARNGTATMRDLPWLSVAGDATSEVSEAGRMASTTGSEASGSLLAARDVWLNQRAATTTPGLITLGRRTTALTIETGFLAVAGRETERMDRRAAHRRACLRRELVVCPEHMKLKRRAGRAHIVRN